MIEEKILEFIAEPYKLTEPEQANEVVGYLNGLLTDLEEKEFEDRLKVDDVWSEARKIYTTNAEADRHIKFTDEYAEHEKTKRTIAKFKRNRDTLLSRRRHLENSSYRIK